MKAGRRGSVAGWRATLLWAAAAIAAADGYRLQLPDEDPCESLRAQSPTHRSLEAPPAILARDPTRQTLYARFEMLEKQSGTLVALRKGRFRADVTGHTEIRLSEPGILVVNGDVVMVDQPQHGWPDPSDVGARAMADALHVLLGDRASYGLVGVQRPSWRGRREAAEFHSAASGRRLCFRVDVATGLVESMNIEDSRTTFEIRLVEQEYVDWLAVPTLDSFSGDGTTSVPCCTSDIGN